MFEYLAGNPGVPPVIYDPGLFNLAKTHVTFAVFTDQSAYVANNSMRYAMLSDQSVNIATSAMRYAVLHDAKHVYILKPTFNVAIAIDENHPHMQVQVPRNP